MDTHINLLLLCIHQILHVSIVQQRLNIYSTSGTVCGTRQIHIHRCLIRIQSSHVAIIYYYIGNRRRICIRIRVIRVRIVLTTPYIETIDHLVQIRNS